MRYLLFLLPLSVWADCPPPAEKVYESDFHLKRQMKGEVIAYRLKGDYWYVWGKGNADIAVKKGVMDISVDGDTVTSPYPKECSPR